MSLLDTYLPVYETSERHSATMPADAPRVFQAIKSVTSFELPLMRILLAIRAAPALLAGRSMPLLRGDRPVLEGALQSGFVMLGELLDKELVFGVVGAAVETAWRSLRPDS